MFLVYKLNINNSLLTIERANHENDKGLCFGTNTVGGGCEGCTQNWKPYFQQTLVGFDSFLEICINKEQSETFMIFFVYKLNTSRSSFYCQKGGSSDRSKVCAVEKILFNMAKVFEVSIQSL